MRLLSFIIATFFLAALSACSSSDQKDVMKIGFIGPLSGEESASGLDMIRGIELQMRAYNQRGGLHGRMMQLVAEDGQCNGEVAKSAMQKLLDDEEVSAVIGSSCPEVIQAIAPLANAAHVPLLAPPGRGNSVMGNSVFIVYPTTPVAAISSDTKDAFVNLFESTYGEFGRDMSIAAYSFDIVGILIAAMSQEVEGQDLSVTIRTMPAYRGVLGDYEFTSNIPL